MTPCVFTFLYWSEIEKIETHCNSQRCEFNARPLKISFSDFVAKIILFKVSDKQYTKPLLPPPKTVH